jgi:hypothetical protein
MWKEEKLTAVGTTFLQPPAKIACLSDRTHTILFIGLNADTAGL